MSEEEKKLIDLNIKPRVYHSIQRALNGKDWENSTWGHETVSEFIETVSPENFCATPGVGEVSYEELQTVFKQQGIVWE